MRTYDEILRGLCAAVWDGTSDVRCSTGTFTAEQFRHALHIPEGERAYLIGDVHRGVPLFVGRAGEDMQGGSVESCARRRVVKLAEEMYNAQLPEGAERVAFPEELLSAIEVGDSL